MALVGDIIVQVRELGPDPASSLTTYGYPSAYKPTAAGSNVGGTIAAMTLTPYWSYRNPWGESDAAALADVTLAGGTSKVTITFPSAFPAGVTAVRVYLKLSGGDQLFPALGYVESSTPAAVTVVTALTDLAAGSLPLRPTAIVPDADGQFASAHTIYRWLNDALEEAGRISGGISDTTGVRAVSGRDIYSVDGRWVQFTAAWYDGWDLMFTKQTTPFIRSTVTGVSGYISLEKAAEETRLQLYPQPSRTGLQTTITGDISATATSVNLTSVANILSKGLVKIDNEIMAYSGVSTLTLNNLTRGIGGTRPAAHTAGATVTELNVRLAGTRMPDRYSPGDANRTLGIPDGWAQALVWGVMARYREAEQETQKAGEFKKMFTAEITRIAQGSRYQTGPRQVGTGGRETYPGGFWGGVIVP